MLPSSRRHLLFLPTVRSNVVALACGLFLPTFLWCQVHATQAAELQITVDGLRAAEGIVKLAVCDTPECYEAQSGFFRLADVEVEGNSVSVLIPDLPPGEYAISMYHDENANGTFDRNWLGFPQEGFGFSRDAQPVFGKPIYDAVVITVGADGAVVTLTMQYW